MVRPRSVKKKPAAKAKKIATKAKKVATKTRNAATTTPKAGSKSDAALMEKLVRFVRAHAEGYLSDSNITSIGIGYKRTGGQATKQLSIQFSVDSKVQPEELSVLGTKLIPSSINVEGTLVPTDVIERNYNPSYENVELKPKDERRARAERMRPGMSVGSVGTNAGTLGTFVRDQKTKRILLLSNWHVLHGAKGQIGDDVVQPGKFDDNRVERNRIGKLLRSHLGAAGDCALASVSGRAFSNDAIGLDVTVTSVGVPQLDDAVVKSGRTTGVTYGVVTRLQVNTKMNIRAVSRRWSADLRSVLTRPRSCGRPTTRSVGRVTWAPFGLRWTLAASPPA